MKFCILGEHKSFELMKTIVIVFVLFLSKQSFAQHFNNNDDWKLQPLILFKYPNVKDAFSNTFTSKYDLNNNTDSFLVINGPQNTNFYIDTGRRLNKNFAFSQSQQINLSKELLKITHRFPGDGSNLILCPRGLSVP